MPPNLPAWQWRENHVGRSEDHFELRYGSIENSSWDDWLPVALVGRTQERVFDVEFLMVPTDPSQEEIIEAVKKTLSFYLVNKNEQDPWGYAQYHCGTGANAYSMVHWSFHSRTTETGR